MAIKVTSKKPLTGNSRSHALNATKDNKNLIYKLLDLKMVQELE